MPENGTDCFFSTVYPSSHALDDCPSNVKVLTLLFLACSTSAAACLNRVSYVRSAVQWAFLRGKRPVSQGFQGGALFGAVRHYGHSVFLTGQAQSACRGEGVLSPNRPGQRKQSEKRPVWELSAYHPPTCPRQDAFRLIPSIAPLLRLVSRRDSLNKWENVEDAHHRTLTNNSPAKSERPPHKTVSSDTPLEFRSYPAIEDLSVPILRDGSGGLAGYRDHMEITWRSHCATANGSVKLLCIQAYDGEGFGARVEQQTIQSIGATVHTNGLR